MTAGGGPVFVVGTMGSGSTLLRLMLDSHENLAVAQETGFMRAAMANLWPPFFRTGDWYQRLGFSDEELLARMREFYGGLFADFAARSGKRRWGEKTPSHVWQIGDIAALFPDAVFVAIVRHPAGTVTSLHQRFQYDWERAVAHWRRHNMHLLHAAAAVGERLVMCRYEDLVTEPAAVMGDVLRFLGEPWSDAVLRHHEVQRQQGTPRYVEGHNVAHQPVDPSVAAGWTRTLAGEGRALIRERTVPLARYFGYDVDRPAPEGGFGGGEHGKWLLCGRELANRRDDFPEVDWRFRPAPPLGTAPLTPELEERARVRIRPAGEPAKPAARAGAVARRLARRLPLGWRLRVHRALRLLRRRTGRSSR